MFIDCYKIIDDIDELTTSKARAYSYSYGNVNFVNGMGEVDIAYTTIPSTAKCITPRFGGYNSSAQYKTYFNVMIAGGNWRIAYNNTSGSTFEAKLVVEYAK